MSGKLDDSAPTRWRVAGCAREGLRLWDDEIAVYNHASGQTHLLHAIAGDVLLRLLDGPGDAPALIEHVAELAGSRPEECREAVEKILAEMDDLGLIARDD